MWIRILYSFSFLAFLVVPFLYKSERPSMLHFYHRMAVSPAWQRMYTRMLLLFLLVFHFYHLSLFKCQYDMVPSSVLCFLMFSHPLCERTFRYLQHKRMLWAAMVLALSCLFVPHFLPLGYSFGVLLCGAVFYPSRLVCDKLLRPEYRYGIHYGRSYMLAEWYYAWGQPLESQPEKKRFTRIDDTPEDAEIIEYINDTDKV